MRKLSVLWVAVAISAMLLLPPQKTFALELPWSNLGCMLKHSPVDVPCPQSCDQCSGEFCIQRVPVTECVKGKKLVYDAKIRYEYVTIPETRYRFVTRCITKEVKCPACVPTCETTDVCRCYESEQWTTDHLGCGSGQLHCRKCEKKVEKYPCKKCGRKPGEAVVKVHVRECIKEPYVVYRQVKRPVCIKQPRHERTTVKVTRYVCKNCGGCDQGCGESCGQCDEQGCDVYDQ